MLRLPVALSACVACTLPHLLHPVALLAELETKDASAHAEREAAAQHAHAAQATELQALTDSIEELQAW